MPWSTYNMVCGPHGRIGSTVAVHQSAGFGISGCGVDNQRITHHGHASM